MTPPLSTRRLVQESAPVAAILLFWMFLSEFVRPTIATGLVRAGIIMALFYTIVQGTKLAKTYPALHHPSGIIPVLKENVRVALPAFVWLVVAQIVYFVEDIGDVFGIPAWTNFPAEALAFGFIGTSVATVLLFTIAVGLPRIRSSRSNSENKSSGVTPADD